MSNSSPSALERIRRAAAYEAYANARRLGHTAYEANRDAQTVEKFIQRMAEDCYVVER